MSKGKRPRRGSKDRTVEATEAKPFTLPTIEVKPEADETPWDEEGLTVRQRLFVDALTGAAGGNATLAAELAGYRADNRANLAATASENLRKPKVKEAVARRMARASLTPEWLRQMTAAFAASNMGSFLCLDDKGEPRIDWREAERLGAFVQIRKYKEKGFGVSGGGGDVGSITIIERTIETHNPAPHLNLLARLMGLVDGNAPTVNVNVTQLSRDDLVRIATSGGDRVAEAGAGVRIAEGFCQRD